jgi:3-hydroxyacyl-CoA dehydrogenase/enoyl-CoA hydratase/carnithine racemase
MAASPASLTVSFPRNDIAVLTFDLPGKSANILSASVLSELSAHLDALQKREGLAGLIIISAKPGIFIAGADLREFVTQLGAPKEQIAALCERGQSLFARLSSGAFVSVAAIQGICVGGGAELASWCDRRVMARHDKTEFGFPEVKLGLYPGWGGTVRAPRIVGLANAVELITGGESIDVTTAQKMGWADDVCAPNDLIAASIRLIDDEVKSKRFLADRQRLAGPMVVDEVELGFLGATASAMIRQQTKGQYPAPAAALELMLESCLEDAPQALAREAAGMAQLFGSPVNAALLNVFFLTDGAKRETGVKSGAAPSIEVKSLGVIGAGIMGSGIAGAALRRDVPTVLSDASEQMLEKGARGAIEDSAFDRKKKGTDATLAVKRAGILHSTSNLEALANCQLVVEAITENPQAKQDLYKKLEEILPPTAILASNTSTIPIKRLATMLKAPERFCGLHFFNPVRRMQLVEVIRGPKSSEETIAVAVAVAKRLGKSPIVVNDGPGFLVNRLLFPYMNEAIELLVDQVPMASIEKVAVKFGMPMGPLALYDMVGLDTSVYAGRVMWEAFPDRVLASPVLPAMVKAGRLGKKNGKGFFSYENKKQEAQPDPALASIIGSYAREAKTVSDEEITHRLFLPMLIEATRALSEGIVQKPQDVDLGLILGLGFPPFKGGLLFWADQVGAAAIVQWLEKLAPLGKRFEPTPLLLEMAQKGSKFYSRA